MKKAFCLGQRAVDVRVRADEWADPDHHLEAEGVQLADHRLGIGEAAGVEIPLAVVFLPVVVDHQHAGRQSVVHDRVGVLEHVALVLVIHQFDPRVVLRHGEQRAVRQLAVGGKEALRRVPEGVAQRPPGLAVANRIARRRDAQGLAREREAERLLAPDVPALRRDEQRRVLIPAVVAVEVDVDRREAVRHLPAERDGTAPPRFAGQQSEREFGLRRVLRKARRCGAEEQEAEQGIERAVVS